MGTTPHHRSPERHNGWRLDNIPYAQIDRRVVVDDEWFFFVLTTASYIEAASDLYTRNLIAYFEDDAEVVAWLAGGWEPDELRHGASLRRYVELERLGHWPVLKTLVGRAKEVSSEDARCAYRNAYLVRFPDRTYHDTEYRAFEKRVLEVGRRHYPYAMAARMFLKPLGLSERSQRMVVPLLVLGMKRL